MRQTTTFSSVQCGERQYNTHRNQEKSIKDNMEDAQAEIAHQSHTWKNEEEIFQFSFDHSIQTSTMMRHHATIEFSCQ